VWLLAPPQYFSIGIGFSIALPSLLGARLLIALRSAEKQQQSCGASLGVARNTGRRIHTAEVAPTMSLSFVVLGVGDDVLDISSPSENVEECENPWDEDIEDERGWEYIEQ
jgi:hypothetical protein